MAEVHIVDIDGEQWDIKDQSLTTRVAVLETLTNKLQEETEVTELDDIVYNPAVRLSGTVIKRGKLVTVSGMLVLSESPLGAYISNLPKNNSATNKDCVVTWTNYDGDFLGQSVLSFDKGETAITLGVGGATSYPALGQLSISYITE